VVGSWDPSTGAVSVTETMTSCVAENGGQVNGTDSLTGTLTAGAKAGDYTIKTTEQINTTVTYPAEDGVDGGTVTRSCTITRDGSYTASNDTFNGTTSRNNCTIQGSVHQHGGLGDPNILGNLFNRGLNAEQQ
jgi:hypothetical protein